MGKKKKEILDKEYVPFSDGMRRPRLQRPGDQEALGHPRPVLGLRLQQGAHAGYGLVSYWTAYLKANFPAEYMAALLTSVRDDKDKSALYLNECRRMGIKVLPPDVNFSDGRLPPRSAPTSGSACRRSATSATTSSRASWRPAEQGSLRRLPRLPQQGPTVVCNKRVIESLVKAGAVRLAR
jgi:DNA polymerase-3 subunit alpha